MARLTASSLRVNYTLVIVRLDFVHASVTLSSKILLLWFFFDLNFTCINQFPIVGLLEFATKLLLLRRLEWWLLTLVHELYVDLVGVEINNGRLARIDYCLVGNDVRY